MKHHLPEGEACGLKSLEETEGRRDLMM